MGCGAGKEAKNKPEEQKKPGDDWEPRTPGPLRCGDALYVKEEDLPASLKTAKGEGCCFVIESFDKEKESCNARLNVAGDKPIDSDIKNGKVRLSSDWVAFTVYSPGDLLKIECKDLPEAWQRDFWGGLKVSITKFDGMNTSNNCDCVYNCAISNIHIANGKLRTGESGSETWCAFTHEKAMYEEEQPGTAAVGSGQPPPESAPAVARVECSVGVAVASAECPAEMPVVSGECSAEMLPPPPA